MMFAISAAAHNEAGQFDNIYPYEDDQSEPPVSVSLVAVLPDAPSIEQMETMFAQLLNVEAAGYGVPLVHTDYFSPGIYARELFIPAGTVLAGLKHKTEHLVTFSGDITVWHEGRMVRLTGHHTRISGAGAQRIGYAHADTRVTCILPNPDNETDVRKLEAMFVEDSDQLQCNRMPVLPRREVLQ